jgi:hypothetical protein
MELAEDLIEVDWFIVHKRKHDLFTIFWAIFVKNSQMPIPKVLPKSGCNTPGIITLHVAAIFTLILHSPVSCHRMRRSDNAGLRSPWLLIVNLVNGPEASSVVELFLYRTDGRFGLLSGQCATCHHSQHCSLCHTRIGLELRNKRSFASLSGQIPQLPSVTAQ